jgi:hypothetical protein
MTRSLISESWGYLSAPCVLLRIEELALPAPLSISLIAAVSV